MKWHSQPCANTHSVLGNQIITRWGIKTVKKAMQYCELKWEKKTQLLTQRKETIQVDIIKKDMQMLQH